MYVKQLFWIILCYFAGFMVSELFGLPVPANVLGLILLLVLLTFRWIKLSDVEGVADFIISHLALIFVPSAVGIMEYFGLFRANFIKIMVPWFVACVVGYAVTGWVTQAAIRAQERRNNGSHQETAFNEGGDQ